MLSLSPVGLQISPWWVFELHHCLHYGPTGFVDELVFKSPGRLLQEFLCGNIARNSSMGQAPAESYILPRGSIALVMIPKNCTSTVKPPSLQLQWLLESSLQIYAPNMVSVGHCFRVLQWAGDATLFFGPVYLSIFSPHLQVFCIVPCKRS